MKKDKDFVGAYDRAVRRSAELKDFELRKLASNIFDPRTIPDEFLPFVKAELLSMFELGPRKHDQKIELISKIANQLILAGMRVRAVADTRCTSLPGVDSRVKIWDQFVQAGLVRICVGSEDSKMLTRYFATEKLLSLRKEWELKQLIVLELGRNSELAEPTNLSLVVFRTGKISLYNGRPLDSKDVKQPIPFQQIIEDSCQRDSEGKPHPLAVKNGSDFWKAREDAIEYINDSNTNHAFKVYLEDDKKRPCPVDPRLRELHSGQAFRAVRLYTFGELSGQSFSKKVRRTMLIDGEAATELDFSCMALRMLYHRCHLEPKGDVYRPKRIFPNSYKLSNLSRKKKNVLRKFVKIVTNICLNTKSRAKAVSATNSLLNKHKESAFLKAAIKGFEQLTTKGLIARVAEVHVKVAEWFFCEEGLELMTTESNIMRAILNKFAEAKKPALAIHDAIVVKASDVEFAEQTMRDSYRLMLRKSPEITRSF